MTDIEKSVLRNYLSRDQLSKVIDLKDGEFFNYPKKDKVEYYGIKGKVIRKGIILRETIINFIDFSDDYTPLEYEERLTICNINGVNIVVTARYDVDYNHGYTPYEDQMEIHMNSETLDYLYENYEEFIKSYKKRKSNDTLAYNYGVTKVLGYQKPRD